METVKNKTQFALKRYRERSKKIKEQQHFNKKAKEQFSKTHTVSQQMNKKKLKM